VLRAMLNGRFAEADDLIAEGLRQAGSDRSFLGDFGGQLLFLRRQQGRLSEAMPLLRYAVQESGGMGLFRCGLVAALAENGDVEEARQELADLAKGDFGVVLRDLSWTVSLAFLAEAVSQLDDQAESQVVLDHLAPHSGHLAVMGWGVLCLGAVDRYLGMLELTLGRVDDAVGHLQSALAMEEGLGFAPAASRTRYWLGRALLRRGGAEDRLRAKDLVEACIATAKELGMQALVTEAGVLLAG
jgi:hypothetical protein